MGSPYDMHMRALLGLMAAVAIAFAIVISFGFWIHERTSAIPDVAFGLFAYLAIFAISFGLARWFLGPFPWRIGKPFKKDHRPVPIRTVAQKAYFVDFKMTVTCEHLAPVESAMRRKGLHLRMMEEGSGSMIKAACRTNFEELQREFSLPVNVRYSEEYENGRPRAHVICGYCKCDILVMHPEECSDGTPWFPTPP